jgi:hypothetical protein
MMMVAQPGTEPSLIDVLRDVWRARLGVSIGLIAGCLVAGMVLALAVPHMRVTMVVGPADNAARTDIKALLPDNPSFALQYLVSTMGSKESTDFSRFEQMLRGPAVAAQVFDDPVFRAAFERTGLFRFSGRAPVKGAEDLSERMMKKIRIEPVGNTAMRRIIFDHPDKDAGIKILDQIYMHADRMIRADVSGRAMARATYLKELLPTVQHPDHRRAVTSLLMEQEHILMILAMDEPFAAIQNEAPYASVKPVWPQKNIIFSAFAVFGMMAGYVLQGIGRRRP